MAIDVVAEIKRQSLLQYIGGQAEKISGGLYRVQPCPLCGHHDCFTVYDDTNTYKCYSCGKSGSIIDYVIDKGVCWDVKAAIEKLCDEFKIEREPFRQESGKSGDSRLHGNDNGNSVKRQRIQEILNLSAEFYHQQLLKHKPSMAYLIDKRKRSERLINELCYGYAGNRSALTTYLTGKGYTPEEQIASGLVKCKDAVPAGITEKSGDSRLRGNDEEKILDSRLRGNDVKGDTFSELYDHFGNGHIIYPHFMGNNVVDVSSKPIDKTKDNPNQLRNEYKLRNSLFYGQDSVYAKEVILVEGQEDRNAILECGKYDVVAIIGQISDNQLGFLYDKCQGKTVYCCFDNDAAGEKYTFKVTDALIERSIVQVIELPEKINDIDEWLRSEKMLDSRLYGNDGQGVRGNVGTGDKIVTATRNDVFAEAIKNSNDAIYHIISKMPADIADLGPQRAKKIYEPIVRLLSKIEDQIARNRYLNAMAERFGSKSDFLPALKNEIRKIREGITEDEGEADRFKSSVFKRGNQYLKDTKDAIKPISEFVMKITRYVEVDDTRHYEIRLTNKFGITSKPIMLSNEQRINQRQFDAAIAGMGSYYFSGSLNDLKEVWQLEENEADIQSITCQKRKLGYIKEEKVWLFKNCGFKSGKMFVAEPDNDIIEIEGIGYQSYGVRVYGGDLPEINLAEIPSFEYLKKIINLMWEMWDAPETGNSRPKNFKGFMAMGFVAATIYLTEITEKIRLFPFLMGYGPPSTGKTAAIQFIMNIFGIRNGGENWKDASVAGISQMMEQLSSFPALIEEFSNSMGAADKQQSKVELLKGIYNRSGVGKGGLNGRRLIYEVNAGLILIGQDRPENPALLSRCIILRKEKPTERGTQAYYELKAEEKRLSIILRWLIENKTKDSVDKFFCDYDKMVELLKTRIRKRVKDCNERTIANYAVFAVGFGIFGYDDYDDEFVNWIVDECIKDMSQKQNEDLIYKFFESIEICFQHTMTEIALREGNRIYIHMPPVYNAWIINQQRTGMNEKLSYRGLLDYIEKDPAEYWMANSVPKYVGSTTNQVRCVEMDVSKMPQHIKEVVTGWYIWKDQGEI